MTKSELIDAIASSRKLPRRTAEELVNMVFDAMIDALVDGGRIEVRGFGSFKVCDYQGYQGRNPRTGQAIFVRPKRLPKFKVSKVLKAQVDKGLRES